MSKDARSGKLLLMVGLGLCGLVLLDTHQDVVEARELSPDSADNAIQSQPSSPTDWLNRLTSAVLSPTTTSQDNVAVNTAIVDAGAAPSGEAPAQVATNDWQGASFPVENFQAYTSPFGYRQSATGGYTQEFHYGLDMAAPQGSYIRNWWGGTVVEVSDDSNCGTSVVVESGQWTHIYCHMQGHVESDSNGRYMIDREGGVQIWEGQQIAAGERIGRVGMTGRTTGPHLHWGLKYSDNWVDPALVLRAMYSGQQNAYAPNGSDPVQ